MGRPLVTLCLRVTHVSSFLVQYCLLMTVLYKIHSSPSEGVKGTMTSAWKRVTGGAGSEDLNPPTDPELRALLINRAVEKIAAHIVNPSETVEVYLAKQRGALDEGDKQATAG